MENCRICPRQLIRAPWPDADGPHRGPDSSGLGPLDNSSLSDTTVQTGNPPLGSKICYSNICIYRSMRYVHSPTCPPAAPQNSRLPMPVFSRCCCRIAAVPLGLSYALILHTSPSRSTSSLPDRGEAVMGSALSFAPGKTLALCHSSFASGLVCTGVGIGVCR